MNENNFNTNIPENNNLSNAMPNLNSNSTNEMSNEFVEKSRKKTPLIIALVIIIILIVGVAGFVLFQKYLVTKNPIKELITSSFDYLEGNIQDKEKVGQNLTFSIKNNSESNEILDILEKLDLSLDYSIDYQNKLADSNYHINYDNQKLLDASFYIDNDEGYALLNGIYDKYIKFDMEGLDTIFQKDNISEQKIVINSIERALNTALKDEYFKVEKVADNGKKVTKTSVVLDKQTTIAIEKDLINTLLSDQKFISSYAKIDGITESEVKEKLNSTLEEANNSAASTEDYEPVNISAYSNGNNLIKFEISTSEDNLVITKNNDSYDYNFTLEEVNIYGNISKKENNSNNEITISINEDTSKLSFEISITSSDKKVTSIDKKDVSNSVSADELSEEEIEDIETKISEQEGIKNFMNDLLKILGLDDSSLEM